MASKRILSKTLLATLLLSLGANLYLVFLVVQWQEAWTQQILTTANLEQLYRHSGADTSYAALRRQAQALFYQVEPTRKVADPMTAQLDEQALKVDGTVLMFKDGLYQGSRADLPDGLRHWGIEIGD